MEARYGILFKLDTMAERVLAIMNFINTAGF